MKRLLTIILFSMLVSNITQAADFYWFGSVSGLGSGNWSTPSCWSPNSTGNPRYTVELPSSADNVYFIGSSFRASSQTLTINVPAIFNTLSVSGDALPFIINGGSLNVYGSVFLSSVVSFTGFPSFTLLGSATSNIFDGARRNFNLIQFNASGNYKVSNLNVTTLDKLSAGTGTVSISGFSTVLGNLSIYNGQVVIRDTLNVVSFNLLNLSATARTNLNMDNSTINIISSSGSSFPGFRIQDLNGALHTISGINSTIKLKRSSGFVFQSSPSSVDNFGNIEVNEFDFNINGSSQLFINKLIVNGGQLPQNIRAFSVTIGDIQWNGFNTKNFFISNLRILNDFKVQTFPCKVLNLQSQFSGTQSTISLLGSNFNSDFLTVRDINANSANPFIAGPNSVNLGNNTNWIFINKATTNYEGPLGENVITCSSPFTINTSGFGTFSGINWSNNSISRNLTVTTSGLYIATVNFSGTPTCTFVDDIHITILPKPSPVITGPTTVGINQSNVIYSTNSVPGNIFAWTVPGFVSLNSPLNQESINVSFANFTTGSFIVQSSNTIPGCIGISSLRVESTTTSNSIPTCTTPSLIISGSASVCPGVSAFYSIDSPNRTSNYQWTISGTGSLVAGQGTSRVFVTFGATINDLVSVREITRSGCVGAVYSLPIAGAGNTYAVRSADLNCANNSFTIPVLATSTVAGGIVSMDLTLRYDPSLITPTGVSFLGNVVRQTYPANAITLYTTYNRPGVVQASISYSAFAPSSANFVGPGTIIGFTFSRLPAFLPGTSTGIAIAEIIEGNYAGINYSCGASGVVTLNNNEVTGVLTHTNGRVIAYNSAVPTQFNQTRIRATDLDCEPSTYVVNPDLNGNFKFNIDNGEKISIDRDIPGSYYSTTTSVNVQSVINSNDANLLASELELTFPNFTPSWKEIGNNALKLARVYAMDVDLDGLVTSLDLFYIQKRSVLQLKEFPQVWNYRRGVPVNTVDISKDWVFVDRVKFAQLAASLNSVSILPSLDQCFDEPVPNTSSCTPLGTISYQGILLGDVDQNWNVAPLNSSAIRSSNENQFVVTLDSIISIAGGYLIPLQVLYADSVKAIDFNFDYDSTQYIVADVVPTFDKDRNPFIWNNYNNETILAGAYSKDIFDKEKPVYYLKLLSSVPIRSSSFKSFKSYINGNEVPVVFREGQVTETNGQSFGSNIQIYPNPTSGELNIIGSTLGDPNVSIHILNAAGQHVLASEIQAKLSYIHTTLDVSALNQGVYYIKLTSASKTKMVKLVKQ